ncbi:hypothetical protein [Noviherbaspirillum galbum]|uniref:Uncharacterized protein n=1 Tax=Noviherbaspirillum galbum TaxID=2709383 RepID=A0A6B3SRN6_9BURK|nr:hypothetical protein [Noviherbaspirillum galbum]NEX63354.1 hypothetical protein [Noviherbaspirillum galbum]
MSETISSHKAQRPATFLNVIAAGLVLTAFAAPFIFVTDAADDIAGRVAETMGAMLIPFGLAWHMTKNDSNRAKAIGRIFAAVVVCLVVGNGVFRSLRQEEQAKNFIKSVLEHTEKQIKPYQELDARFNAINLSTVLTPETVITAKGRDAARQVVRQFRDLLAEREVMIKVNTASNENFIRDNAPNERLRKVALSGFERNQSLQRIT